MNSRVNGRIGPIATLCLGLACGGPGSSGDALKGLDESADDCDSESESDTDSDSASDSDSDSDGDSDMDSDSEGSTIVWSAGPLPPAPRRSHASFIHDRHLFVAGGLDDTSAHREVYVAPIACDGSLGAWAETEPLPQVSDGHTAVVVENFVYVIGGDHPASAGTWFAPIGSGAIGTWSPTTSLPGVRIAHASVAAHEYIYVLGGTSGSDTLDEVRYAEVTAGGHLGSWQSTTSLPVGRRYLSAETNGTFIYVLGGITADRQRLASVIRAPVNADGSLGSWEETSQMQVGRNGHASVLSQGSIIVFGGVAPGDTILESVEGARIVAPGALGAFVMTTPLNEPSWLLRAAAIAGTLYVTGGENFAGTQRSVRIGR